MNIKKLENFANKQLAKHGLTDWSFAWNNTKRSTGKCRYRNKTIYLSKICAPLQSEEASMNTIIHEVAHALTPGEGHSDVWMAKFIAIGGSGERWAVNTPPPYTWVMEFEGVLAKGYYRKPTVAMRKLSETYLKGRKEETLGKLVIRKI